MIRPERTCKKVIMTFTLTINQDFHSLSTKLSLNQAPRAEKTLYPASNPLSHLSTRFKYFSGIFQPGCAKSGFEMEVVGVNI